MIDTLVLDAPAVELFTRATVTHEWLADFGLPSGETSFKRVKLNSIVYILSKKSDESTKFLIMRADVLRNIDNFRHGFDRILHVALATFDRRITIPASFHQFNHGSCVSVYSQPELKGANQRIFFDRAPRGNNRILYLYAITTNIEIFEKVDNDLSFYDKAIENILDALLLEQSMPGSNDVHGIELFELPSNSYIGSSSLEEWYDRKLTREQRAFVDRDLSRPVRLRGAAGTGKTVSLVIKCAKEYLNNAKMGSQFRIAFITHSYALSHDVVRSMIDALTPNLSDSGVGELPLFLGSLYELIQNVMKYQQKDLKPLSLDGMEGREYQKILINDFIDYIEMQPDFALMFREKCSSAFRSFFKIEKRERFVDELIHEFATTIDADGVRLGNLAADKYIKAQRDRLQISAPEEIDRQIILRIHDNYCRRLVTEGTLSMDQMVADFLKYLETHEWKQLKERSGFNLIFVDELHYFNKFERMCFSNLFRSDAKLNGNCPLFTAQDIKQGVSGVALSRGPLLINAGNAATVDLTKAFRSTEYISNLLSSIDGAFPALDLGEEWGTPPKDVFRSHGDLPTYFETQSEIDAVDLAVKYARRDARQIGGRNVAILCCDESALSKYSELNLIMGEYELLASRDHLGRMRYAGGRPILSTPDFVAGLQFSVVYILNAENYQEDIVDRTLGEKRRFISKLYLGASRACDKLIFIFAKERGGPADALLGAINSRKLIPCV